MNHLVIWIFLLGALIHSPLQGAEIPFGYLEPSRTLKLSLAEVGVLSELMVKEGDAVKKDQILAKLDCRVLEQELGINKAQTEFIEKRHERYEELRKAGRLTPEEYEKSSMELTVERLKMKRAEASIESRTLRSPINGVITEVKKQILESVTPASSHILTVVELDPLALTIYLSPEKAAPLKADQEISVLLVEGNTKYKAKVEFVSPVTDSASRTVRVRITLPNPDHKLPTGAKAILAPSGK